MRIKFVGFRKWGIWILASALFLVNACSGAPTPTQVPTVTPGPQPAATVAEETETPAVPLDPNAVSFMVFGDDAEKKAYDALVGAFKAKYPNIPVALIYVPNQFAYRDQVSQDFALGQPYDVLILNNRRYGFYGLRKLLVPLDAYLAQSSVVHEVDFLPGTIDAFRLNGVLNCIPQNASSLVVYYNKALFDQDKVAYPHDGWTWDDLLADAKALTHDTNGDGKNDQFGLGTEADLLRMAPFIWQNGGEIVNSETKPTKLALDSPAALAAIQWVVDLQTKYHVVPSPEDEVLESFESRFVSGKVAMFINQRRGVGTYRDNAKFDWDVAPLPQNKRAAGVLQSDAYCIPIASNHKANAWKLVEFASSVEGQTILAASGRNMPSLRAVAQSEAFLQPGQKPEHAQVFIDTLSVARSFPVLLNWPQIEEIAGEEMERAFHGTVSLNQVLPRAVERTTILFPK